MIFLQILKSLSCPNCKRQGAKILRECSPPTCNVLRVTCQVFCVTCQLSCVIFHFFLSSNVHTKMLELVGGGSVINGSYPVYLFNTRNLPRIVLQAAQLLITWIRPTSSSSIYLRIKHLKKNQGCYGTKLVFKIS